MLSFRLPKQGYRLVIRNRKGDESQKYLLMCFSLPRYVITLQSEKTKFVPFQIMLTLEPLCMQAFITLCRCTYIIALLVNFRLSKGFKVSPSHTDKLGIINAATSCLLSWKLNLLESCVLLTNVWLISYFGNILDKHGHT